MEHTLLSKPPRMWVVLSFFFLTMTAQAKGFDVNLLVKPTITPFRESFRRLSRANIMVTDRSVLDADFDLAGTSPENLNQMLLSAGAMMSLAQSGQQKVNSPIPYEKVKVPGYRPAAYGRSAVFPFLDSYVDVKGTGSYSAPTNESHSNGLVPLSGVLREYLLEKIVALIFQVEGYSPGVVPSYAVADAGFDVYMEGGPEPAGLLFRRAHGRRPTRPDGYTDTELSSKIESILRKYGIASDFRTLATKWQMLRDNNVQTDVNGAMFDFESLLVTQQFSNSPVNPDPELRLPFAQWGYGTKAHPMHDRLREWSRKVAFAFRAGTISQTEIERQIEEDWLGPIKANVIQKTCTAVFVVSGPAKTRTAIKGN